MYLIYPYGYISILGMVFSRVSNENENAVESEIYDEICKLWSQCIAHSRQVNTLIN